MNTDQFNKFCSRHSIKILEYKNEYYHYITDYTYFSDKYDYNKVMNNTVPAKRRVCIVQIPDDELTKIQEFEDQVFNYISDYGHYNLFQILMEQKEHEERLREQFPAVQKAYENYSLMLNLCKQGENNGTK